jgi:uncharacterized protein (TIGR01244 family)
MNPSRLILAGLLSAWLIGGTTAADTKTDMPDIPHAVQPHEKLLIGGQPSERDMRQAAKAGVKTVINLRGAGEHAGYDQDAVARGLGITYIAIPVSGREDLNADNVSAFGQAVRIAGDRPALMHCASGNRVGALFALHAGMFEDKSIEEAVEIGRQHGLTGLESTVREILEQRGG